MRDFKLSCGKCKFTTTMTLAQRPTREHCPRCRRNGVNNKMKVRMLPKVLGQRRKDFNAQNSVALTREPRSTRAIPSKKYQDFNTAEDDDFYMDEDGADAARQEFARPVEEEDDVYAPTVGFTPSFRLSSTNSTCRGAFPATTEVAGAFTAVMESHKTTAVTISNKDAVMATALGSGAKPNKLSATEWATKNAPAALPKLDYEWCHIIADCLGGPTSAANLFAGGYHANTHMMYIEMACKGRGYLEVRVQVFVSHPKVGDHIIYSIREKGSNRAALSITIDALSQGFSRKDRDDLTAVVKPYIAQCQAYKRDKQTGVV